jgi:hypothetical protein
MRHQRGRVGTSCAGRAAGHRRVRPPSLAVAFRSLTIKYSTHDLSRRVLARQSHGDARGVVGANEDAAARPAHERTRALASIRPHVAKRHSAVGEDGSAVDACTGRDGGSTPPREQRTESRSGP